MSSKNFAAAAAMMDTVPRFDEHARRLSIEIYRQLIGGDPVEQQNLASALGVEVNQITDTLEDEQLKGWVFYDNEGRIIGFRGLAIREMPHRFEVSGRTLYTWCAIDSLFIPEIIEQSARVESRDPGTGNAITLTVTSDGVHSVDPPHTMMSILVGDPEVVKTEPTKVMASFCHHIFFLESPDSGAEWAAQHGQGAFLVTLEEAFALGKRLNAAQYGDLTAVLREVSQTMA